MSPLVTTGKRIAFQHFSLFLIRIQMDIQFSPWYRSEKLYVGLQDQDYCPVWFSTLTNWIYLQLSNFVNQFQCLQPNNAIYIWLCGITFVIEIISFRSSTDLQCLTHQSSGWKFCFAHIDNAFCGKDYTRFEEFGCRTDPECGTVCLSKGAIRFSLFEHNTGPSVTNPPIVVRP